MAVRHLTSLLVCSMLLASCALLPATEKGSPSNTEETATTTADSSKSKLSTPELIDAARTEGKISSGERILYLAYALYDYDSLPDEYKSDSPWRGTLIVREINQVISSPESMCALEPEVQKELRRLLPASAKCPP